MNELFQPYESKPIVRMAFQITDAMMIGLVPDQEASWDCFPDKNNWDVFINFKAYETPKVGDWIVRLTETDTYHCTDAVFRERNIVP